MKKKNISIFTKLVISYLIFAASVITIFVLCLLGTMFTVSEGNIKSSYPYDIVNENGELKDITGIVNFSGWVEELDSNYRVINVYGEKKTDNKVYKPNELVELTNTSHFSKEKYIGFINNKINEDGYYLVLFNRKDIKVDLTFLLSNEGTNQKLSSLFLVVFFILFAFLCIIMGYYLSRQIKKPLKQLIDGMKRVKNGEENVKLDFKVEAEFAELRDSFNLMITSLENEKNQKELNERKKERMLLELSHDIRTPIATINSYSIALEEGLVKQEELDKYYRTIRNKASRVVAMSDDMFTMLKMESNEYKITKIMSDICEFVRQQCVEYYGDAESDGIEIEADIPEEAIYYEADYKLMERVIGNLITNAIKYNKTGKSIYVSVKKNDNNITISVEDDGEQINPQITESLFDAFTRGDKARKTDGGTGLGLTIAQAIVEKHGGKINYLFNNERNCFSIILN